jgi:hypothetical protein
MKALVMTEYKKLEHQQEVAFPKGKVTASLFLQIEST